MKHEVLIKVTVDSTKELPEVFAACEKGIKWGLDVKGIAAPLEASVKEVEQQFYQVTEADGYLVGICTLGTLKECIEEHFNSASDFKFGQLSRENKSIEVTFYDYEIEEEISETFYLTNVVVYH